MPAPRKYSDELRGRAQRLVAEAMSEAANVDRGVSQPHGGRPARDGRFRRRCGG